MAIGATIALPELLRRGYDKVMVTGVIQAGISLGILIPPSVVLVLYAMIARQPVLQLWLAGIMPGPADGGDLRHLHLPPLPASSPELGPALPEEERAADHLARRSSRCCAKACMPLADLRAS